MRRVVVTGIGLVTPLGASASVTWDRLINGESGISKVTQFDVHDLPAKIAGTVPEGATDLGLFCPDDWVEPKEQRKVDRFILLGMVAASQAVQNSGWIAKTPEEQNRTGVIIGSGIGGLQQIHDNAIKLNESGPRRISPFLFQLP